MMLWLLLALGALIVVMNLVRVLFDSLHWRHLERQWRAEYKRKEGD